MRNGPGCGDARDLAAFYDTEFTADLDTAEGGVLPRTDHQRRAVALYAIFLAAAAGGQGGTLDLVVNYVIDDTTFDDELRRLTAPRSNPRIRPR